MNYDKYENKLPWPMPADFSTTYFYKGGELVGKVNGNITVEIAKLVPKGFSVQETVRDDAAFAAARQAYQAETAARMAEFKNDLFYDNGFVGEAYNEFTEKLFSIAWEKGHSSGLAEVASVFEDLVELVDIAKRTYG